MPDRVIKRLNGARGSALLSIGFTGVAHGIAYLPIQGPASMVPSGLQAIGSVLPLSFYAGLWITIGAVAIGGAFTDRLGYPRDWDRWGFYGFVGIVALWSFGYYVGFALSVRLGIDWPGPAQSWWRYLLDLAGAVHFEGNRQWISGAVYLGVAGLALASMRMRNRFIIDLRDFVFDMRGDP